MVFLLINLYTFACAFVPFLGVCPIVTREILKLLIPFSMRQLSQIAVSFLTASLFLSCPAVLTSQPDASESWAVRMVESEMARNPEAWQLDCQPKLKWDYCHGLDLRAFLYVA